MVDFRKELLKQKVQKNTTITKKSSEEGEVSVKQGTPLDHRLKHHSQQKSAGEVKKALSDPVTNSELPIVGVSLGVTRNMDNYESLRIDCWVTDCVKPGETKEQALDRLSDLVKVHLEKEASKF
jgi:hypothetical protein